MTLEHIADFLAMICVSRVMNRFLGIIKYAQDVVAQSYICAKPVSSSFGNLQLCCHIDLMQRG